MGECTFISYKDIDRTPVEEASEELDGVDDME